MDKNTVPTDKPTLSMDKPTVSLNKPTKPMNMRNILIEMAKKLDSGCDSPDSSSSDEHTSTDTQSTLNDMAKKPENGCDTLQSSSSDKSENVPMDNTTVSMDKTTIPMDKTTIPLDKTTVSMDKPTEDMDKTTIQMDNTTIPMDKPAIPMGKTTIPMDKPTVSMDKPTGSKDKPTELMDKPAVPMDKQNVLINKVKQLDSGCDSPQTSSSDEEIELPKMLEEELKGKDLFTQDGVLLKACLGRPVTDLNSIGMLCIVQNQDDTKCVEWRPNDLITIDSDTTDQEWAVVNTIGRRQRTFSGNITSDYATARARIIKIPLDELKTFRVTRNNQQMQFSTKSGVWQNTFYFQHGNAEIFVAYLKNHVKTAKTRHDRNTYVIVEPNMETQVLNKSFAELDIFTENTTDVVWNLVSNFKQRPYETTMEAFSKLTDIVYYSNEGTNGKRVVSEEVTDLLTKSMGGIEDATTVTRSDEYEVISVKPTLPPRPCIPRGTPLSIEKWTGLQDTEGRITEVEGVKQLIFRGGVAHSIRQSVWKYLLDYHPWHMTHTQLKALTKKRTEEYFSMKLQWRSMTEGQESRFSDYRDRKSLVEKDVNRTDRTHPFFAGDNNPNLVVLQDILMTYVMYNFDLGYVQGMSDILAPVLLLMGNEVDTFWCFVGFMDRIGSNFDMDQAGMKHQLLQLQQLLSFVSPELANHLSQKDSGNMYFTFRWLLVWFKREFSHRDIMRLWEVLWTSLPCANFHLFIAVAILDAEKETILSKNYGFTEILKHVNDLSMCLDVDKILSTAEGIYHQVVSAPHLTDQIRMILGLPTLGITTSSHSDDEQPSTSKVETNGYTRI